MKAVIRDSYGPPDVLELQEIEKPIPKDNEILIKVNSASVNRADSHGLRGTPFIARIILGGIIKPKVKILGYDFAGKVESVGKDVTEFQPNDEVFGTTKDAGGFAEYLSTTEDLTLIKPPNVSFEDAASVPAVGIVALQCLQQHGKIQSGQDVLINGASGGVGTSAVQIAKVFGANVTGVCSTTNLDMVRSIGADKVIDYKKEDFTQSTKMYDLIFDAVAKSSFSDCKPLLKPYGRYVTTAFSLGLALKAKMVRGDRKMIPILAKPTKKDLMFLKDLLEAGKLKPIIDRRYNLKQVPDAIRYLEKGHVKGKLIINVDSFYYSKMRGRSSFENFSNQEKREAYGVGWILFKPDAAARLVGINLKPWADGPYCPMCEQELVNEVKGKVRKKEVWYCPRCKKNYEKPNGDVKAMVEKEFEADLRRRRES
jgi:NADPH:quinone reductase-like Zn-dependent oxidoreductase/ribosomal protein L37AE/L43A